MCLYSGLALLDGAPLRGTIVGILVDLIGGFYFLFQSLYGLKYFLQPRYGYTGCHPVYRPPTPGPPSLGDCEEWRDARRAGCLHLPLRGPGSWVGPFHTWVLSRAWPTVITEVDSHTSFCFSSGLPRISEVASNSASGLLRGTETQSVVKLPRCRLSRHFET